jgi:flagellin
MVQIAEGALDEVTSILQRMRDLAVQADNGSLTSTERGYLDAEHSKLATTLGSVIDQSQFNGTDLVDDSSATPITIQAGADASDTISVSFAAMTEATLKVTDALIDMDTGTVGVLTVSGDPKMAAATAGTLSVTIDGVKYTDTGAATALDDNTKVYDVLNHADMQAADGTTLKSVFDLTKPNGNSIVFTSKTAGNDIGSTVTFSHTGGTTFDSGTTTLTTSGGRGITAIDLALAAVASERATLGATQAQLESTVRNLANVAENTSAAAGRIMDTDYAAETANLTKAQILQQAATSVLAQANAQPQSVLACFSSLIRFKNPSSREAGFFLVFF